jgi:PPOX class probable FMN-dependent enzyme
VWNDLRCRHRQPQRATTAGGVIGWRAGSRIMAATNGSKPHVIANLAELEALFPEEVYPPAKIKETDRITNAYRALIEASPFCVMATSGPSGLDSSPRGDPKGFVRVVDEKTVILPERRGNNRIDSLRNLVTDPRVSLLFLIPGVSETVRVMGRATISADPALCASFAIQGKAPRCVLVISVEQVFFQCAKALVRAKLWDPSLHVERSSLPTAGKILAEISGGKLGGDEHDRLAPERMKATIY